MSVLKIKDIGKKVEIILNQYENSRNSDNVLFQKFCITFLHGWIIEYVSGDYYYHHEIVKYRSQVERWRRKLDKKYPPTDPDVAKARGWSEEDWKEALGYKVEDSGQISFA